MSKKRGLRYGVIGLGSMGKNHCRIISTISGAHLAAISDIDQAQGQALAQQYQTQYFPDYMQMLDQVDAVSIVTPTATHYKVATELLQANKHCLIEKPITKISDQALELVDLAKEKNVNLAVGFVERYNPAFIELKKLIRKEKIIGLEFKRFSPFPERISDASVIEDMMIHDLDLLLDLLPNNKIESIKAEGKKIKTKMLDKVSACFYLESGAIAKISADRTNEERVRKIMVTIEKGMIEADLMAKSIYFRDFQHPTPSVHATKQHDQLTEELQDFIKSIKLGIKPNCTGTDGYNAIKLAEEVQNLC